MTIFQAATIRYNGWIHHLGCSINRIVDSNWSKLYRISSLNGWMMVMMMLLLVEVELWRILSTAVRQFEAIFGLHRFANFELISRTICFVVRVFSTLYLLHLLLPLLSPQFGYRSHFSRNIMLFHFVCMCVRAQWFKAAVYCIEWNTHKYNTSWVQSYQIHI